MAFVLKWIHTSWYAFCRNSCCFCLSGRSRAWRFVPIDSFWQGLDSGFKEQQVNANLFYWNNHVDKSYLLSLFIDIHPGFFFLLSWIIVKIFLLDRKIISPSFAMRTFDENGLENIEEVWSNNWLQKWVIHHYSWTHLFILLLLSISFNQRLFTMTVIIKGPFVE